MIAQAGLSVSSWAGRLPNVADGEAFWASSRDVTGLVAAGLAELAPPGTVAPPVEPAWTAIRRAARRELAPPATVETPVEPAWTANGSPGFAAGTSNSTN